MNSLKLMMLAALAALPVLAADAKPAAPLNLRVGQKVSLVLDGNPTTGYIWQLKPALPAGSPVQVELSLVRNEEENCCGFPTPTTLTMTGVKPGTQLVRVVYARPWEKGKAPVQEKRFAVTVLPAEK
ncbi:MAG: protease inhibitor I42 family protein [Akkermansia sp.]|nr:protease inhibitor I42 family protein [Akkermansia sp.]